MHKRTQRKVSEATEHLKSVMLKVQNAREELRNSVYELADALTQLPQNPAIRPIKGPCLMFIVKRKDLGDKWSPEYMQWRYQYGVIADAFRHDPLHAIDWWLDKRRLGRIVKYRYDYDPFSGKFVRIEKCAEIDLHPEVIRNVDELLGITGEENE